MREIPQNPVKWTQCHCHDVTLELQENLRGCGQLLNDVVNKRGEELAQRTEPLTSQDGFGRRASHDDYQTQPFYERDKLLIFKGVIIVSIVHILVFINTSCRFPTCDTLDKQTY